MSDCGTVELDLGPGVDDGRGHGASGPVTVDHDTREPPTRRGGTGDRGPTGQRALLLHRLRSRQWASASGATNSTSKPSSSSR